MELIRDPDPLRIASRPKFWSPRIGWEKLVYVIVLYSSVFRKIIKKTMKFTAETLFFSGEILTRELLTHQCSSLHHHVWWTELYRGIRRNQVHRSSYKLIIQNGKTVLLEQTYITSYFGGILQSTCTLLRTSAFPNVIWPWSPTAH
jgi:hypothetical protein